jgi:predicted RNase H-like HicB family nuclease
MKYAIVIERAENNYSAYVPDLPGCVATGQTTEETKREIADAIAFHLEGMQRAGLPIPEPSARTDHVEVKTTLPRKPPRPRKAAGANAGKRPINRIAEN